MGGSEWMACKGPSVQSEAAQVLPLDYRGMKDIEGMSCQGAWTFYWWEQDSASLYRFPKDSVYILVKVRGFVALGNADISRDWTCKNWTCKECLRLYLLRHFWQLFIYELNC